MGRLTETKMKNILAIIITLVICSVLYAQEDEGLGGILAEGDPVAAVAPTATITFELEQEDAAYITRVMGQFVSGRSINSAEFQLWIKMKRSLEEQIVTLSKANP